MLAEAKGICMKRAIKATIIIVAAVVFIAAMSACRKENNEMTKKPEEFILGMNINDKTDALYNFTKKSLKSIKAAGADIGMVQIGNETNGAMCGETAPELGGWQRITQLMSAGSKAVREECPDAQVVMHFANPEKPESYESYSANLDYYSVDYDVFASSYYPFWHGTLDNLLMK